MSTAPFNLNERVFHVDGRAGYIVGFHSADIAIVLWDGAQESGPENELNLRRTEAEEPSTSKVVEMRRPPQDSWRDSFFAKIALPMIEMGVPVIRLRYHRKEPVDTGWQNLATTDINVVEALARETPGANCGSVAKSEPNGILLFETDQPGIIKRFESETGQSFSTFTVQSQPGHYHFYFRQTPESIALGSIKQGPGGIPFGSLRQHNAYCVSPGSIHPDTGEPYKTVRKAPIIPIPTVLLDWLKLQITKPQPSQAPVAANTNSERTLIPHGQIHDALLSEAGRMRYDGHTVESIEASLILWAHANCAPPINEAQVRQVAQSMEKYEQGDPRLKSSAFVAEESSREAVKQLDEWLAPENKEPAPEDLTELIAAINRLDYETRRSKLAKKSGIRKGILDTERGKVLAHKQAETAAAKAVAFEEHAADAKSKQEVIQLVDRLVFSSPETRLIEGLPSDGDKALVTAADLLWTYLKQSATVNNVEGVGYLLPKGQESTTIKIGPEDSEFVDVLEEFKLYPKLKPFGVVGTHVGVRAVLEGAKAELHSVAHYNDDTKSFYFAESQGNVIKVTADKMERVLNGTDGVLFRFDDKDEDFKLDLDNLPKIANSLMPVDGSELDKALFGGLVFADDYLAIEQRKILITAYIMTLLLPNLICGRVILQILGDSGAGKSFMLKVIGRILAGKKSTVRGFPSDPKEFENQLINNDFAFYDNIQHVPYALRPIFCMAATGGEIARRELFTTSQEVKHKIKAAVGFSAITQVMGETEIANRSLVINLVSRPEKSNVSEKELLDKIDRRRVPLMSELLVRAQAVLRANNNQADFVPKMSLRMADFGTLILRVAKEEGWEQDAWDLINDWHQCQLVTALQNDDVSAALRTWMAQDTWKPCEITAGQLNTRLTAILNRGDKTSWKDDYRSLGKILKRSKASYADIFGLDVTTQRDHSVFKFSPTAEMLKDIRDQVAKEREQDSSIPNPGSRRLPPSEDHDESELPF